MLTGPDGTTPAYIRYDHVNYGRVLSTSRLAMDFSHASLVHCSTIDSLPRPLGRVNNSIFPERSRSGKPPSVDTD